MAQANWRLTFKFKSFNLNIKWTRKKRDQEAWIVLLTCSRLVSESLSRSWDLEESPGSQHASAGKGDPWGGHGSLLHTWGVCLPDSRPLGRLATWLARPCVWLLARARSSPGNSIHRLMQDSVHLHCQLLMLVSAAGSNAGTDSV